MKYDFDRLIDRRGTDSVKWSLYSEDVLPMWVADMDFRSPEPVIEALRERAEHGVFGYSRPAPDLGRVLRGRLLRLYGWEVAEPDIIYLPGIVTGLNVAIQAFAAPGEGVLAQPPVYFHLLRDPVQHGRVLADPPLVPRGDSYEIDFERFERAITPRTRLFLLCNPHNPVGRVWTRAELERMAEICLRHRLVLCSDEIHCELLYPPHRHIPIATLDREVADRTVTLMAPSKTYNIAGLDCGFAVIPNLRLRRRWMEVSAGIVPGVNIMGHTAALAALSRGEEWLGQALAYLRANRDFLAEALPRELPSVRMCRVEATYLAWLDCSATGVTGKMSEFFLERGRVALNDGTDFGKGGEFFVRLNFACPREKLVEGLRRMKKALEM
ncbi:MAG: putative C-S lyase [Acidobacteria bacterium]|nr:putative C-S lyase [Acidobacteriota bacterium]